MTMKIHARAAVLAVCLLLAPALAFAYGGGKDVGGPPGRSGSGATIGSNSAYSSYCNGVTDAESFHREFSRRQEAIDAALPGEAGDAAEQRLAAEMTLSGLAWNENVDVPPRVRQLAMVLESMVTAGDIDSGQALGLVAIYNRGTQLRQQREARNTATPGALPSSTGGTATPAPGASAQDPARYTHNPENRRSLTTTPARYANAINNHQSAVAAYSAYRRSLPPGDQPAVTAIPQDEEHASLLVSTLAWDETLDVPTSVRQMAMIMEGQIMNGTITPRNAYTALMVQLAKTGARTTP